MHAEPEGIIHPFNYDGVSLGPSRWRDQYRHTRSYYLAIPDDDILKGFRERAGLPAPGCDLGGWYSGDGKGGWISDGDVFHMFGQWLSGFARMAGATDEGDVRAKATRLMEGWAETIAPDGYFYFSNHPNAPQYTYDKMVGALVDMGEYLGNQDALRHLDTITRWAIRNLDQTRAPAHYDDAGGGGPRGETEWYTLSENLYRAYQLTGDSTYRNYGQIWHYTRFWSELARGEDAFIGKHAYSHVNALGSAAMAYAVTGDRTYFETIDRAYRFLWRRHTYITGGYGPAERFRAPDGSMGWTLEFLPWVTSGATAETTCGSWAGFKLSRYLQSFTGAAHYGDWVERLFYNAIGASLPMTGRGRTFYYSDYALAGAHKTYHPEMWPCCSGTYPIAVADYHNILYYWDAEGLYVNLFVPSEVGWQQESVRVRVEQVTSFPESEETTLRVHPQVPAAFAIRFRMPGWATGGASVRVNGRPVAVAAEPGQWAEVRRTWQEGDELAIRLPMSLAFVPVDRQHPRRVALMYGPVVLVAEPGAALRGEIQDPSSWVVRTGEPLTFRTRGQREDTVFRPFYVLGEDVPYRMYLDVS